MVFRDGEIDGIRTRMLLLALCRLDFIFVPLSGPFLFKLFGLNFLFVLNNLVSWDFIDFNGLVLFILFFILILWFVAEVAGMLLPEIRLKTAKRV